MKPEKKPKSSKISPVKKLELHSRRNEDLIVPRGKFAKTGNPEHSLND